jgi:uncharacterized SAM-binding protein YcdF (DUF218 family)
VDRSVIRRRDAAAPRNPRLSRRWLSPRRFSRRWRIVLTAALVLFLAFVVATAELLVWPAQGAPSHVSAIVMLAGPGDRLPVALDLANSHRAPVLVVSQGYEGYSGPCPSKPSGTTLICFDPDPPTTQGEAEYVGQLAKRYHWTSVVVVASRPQATRARLLVERCFAGHVYLATGPLSPHTWPYQLAYGWGALAKALVWSRSC